MWFSDRIKFNRRRRRRSRTKCVTYNSLTWRYIQATSVTLNYYIRVIRSIKSFVGAMGTHWERKRVNKCRLYVEWLSLFLEKRKTLLIWFPLQFNRNKACSGDKNFLSSFLTDVDEVNYLWRSKHKSEWKWWKMNAWESDRDRERKTDDVVNVWKQSSTKCAKIFYIFEIFHMKELW